MKIYVRETEKENTDGDKLIKIETFESKPDQFNYLLFIGKGMRK